MREGVKSITSVTEDGAYTINEGLVTPINRDELASDLTISLPRIRKEILKMYPLMDRWVSRNCSISDTVEACMIYTCSLIKIIDKNKTQFAILETGAPHHLFTYCLHTALNYLNIPTYYLSVNGIDSRLNLFRGIEKIQDNIKIETNGQVKNALKNYIKNVSSITKFVPEDSSKVLKTRLNRSFYPVLISYSKHAIYQSLIRKNNNTSNIFLDFKKLTLPELVHNWRKQKKYIKVIKNKTRKFDISQVDSDDIVYVGHMMPEATSFPDSIDYPGEVDVLLDLRNKFPNSSIHYKEHPSIEIFSETGHIHHQGLHKNSSFIKALEILNIGLIPVNLHISELRSRDCLFATKTGRVAIENSLKSAKTIIYGYPFYGTDMPMTIHVSKVGKHENVHKLKEKINNYSPEKIEIYLSKRFSCSIANPGIGAERQPDAYTYIDEIQKIASSIRRKIIKNV